MLFGKGHLVVRLGDFPKANPAEVSVAINPKNPTNVVATSLVTGIEPRSVSYVYTSENSGQTWKMQKTANPENRIQGDDSVAFDQEGRAFRSYISFRGLRAVAPLNPLNGIFVTTSTDEGQTWGLPVAIVDHRNSLTPFEDKPWLSTDLSPESPHQGNIYVAWTRFDRYGSSDSQDQSHVYISRSTNQGQSFSPPLCISDVGGDCLDGDGTVEGAVPAAGIDGELYVVWAGPKGLILDRSLDGGKTFQKDRTLIETPGGWDLAIEGLYRANGFPVTSVDHSRGPYRGTIYVNWIDERNGDPDVFVIASRDQGASWSEPTRINNDPVGNGRAQFFTWMAIDPIDGALNILFFDRRNGKGTETSVQMARSIDGGKTFLNFAVALEPFECQESTFFGDYNGIASYNGLVIGVFPHFTSVGRLALSAAIFQFSPGTQLLQP